MHDGSWPVHRSSSSSSRVPSWSGSRRPWPGRGGEVDTCQSNPAGSAHLSSIHSFIQSAAGRYDDITTTAPYQNRPQRKKKKKHQGYGAPWWSQCEAVAMSKTVNPHSHHQLVSPAASAAGAAAGGGSLCGPGRRPRPSGSASGWRPPGRLRPFVVTRRRPPSEVQNLPEGEGRRAETE